MLKCYVKCSWRCNLKLNVKCTEICSMKCSVKCIIECSTECNAKCNVKCSTNQQSRSLPVHWCGMTTATQLSNTRGRGCTAHPEIHYQMHFAMCIPEIQHEKQCTRAGYPPGRTSWCSAVLFHQYLPPKFPSRAIWRCQIQDASL